MKHAHIAEQILQKCLRERTKTMAREIRTRHQFSEEGYQSEKPEYRPREFRNNRRNGSKIILDINVDKFSTATEVADWVAQYVKDNPSIGVICKIGAGE